MGDRLGLRDRGALGYVWVHQFPMYTWDNEGQRWDATHNPFSAPVPEDIPLLDTDPGRARAQQYDLALNGWEAGGGSVRIHQRELLEKSFALMGHTIEGMLHRHLLSTGMAAFPANCEGVPFDMSHIYASGNLAADMYCNVAAESTGRVLAVRLYNAAHDAGMKDMLHFMIARDTMHQQQWLAVIEELGGHQGALPIPNSFPQEKEDSENAYNFYVSSVDGTTPEGRWTQGPSLDGKGTYSVFKNKPMGEEPVLGPARPDSGAQTEQM